MDRIALIQAAQLDRYGGLICASFFAVFLLMQWKFPLRRQHFSVLRRLGRNLIFSAPGFALARIALVPIPLLVAIWAERNQFGLLHLVPGPRWLAVALGMLVMDYAYWWWHVGLHLVPVLWRFHNVHHSDLDMDVSTATRFHFGEVILSVPFRVVIVAAFGINFLAMVIFEIIFETANLFEHSNWRLPLVLERTLNHLFVTPRMHGIHHSIVQRETNSNWGTIFCWWDFLHRTLRRDIPQDAITIGVAAYRDETELTLGKLFVLPFQSQRAWKLPDGKVPEREARRINELAP
jgi:sterol desaturase/sphingolipid hydroxylase (fatty acid hydroxylase superfamily)